MRRVPVRLRLTLVYAAVMTLVLGAVGMLGYSRLAAGFAADLDRELGQRVQDISGPMSRPGSSLVELGGSGFIERGESFAELVTPTGRVVQATATLRRRPLLGPDQARRAARGSIFVDIPHAPGLDEPARLLATPLSWHGRDLVLVVGATRENGLEALATVRSRMLLLAPVLLLVSSLMAYLLAAEALRPVERLRREAAGMRADAAGQRLDVPSTHDEISRLGETLNGLLAQVEAGVERERTFVAHASHELRTPLALVRTELDLALRRERSRPELEATLTSVSTEVDRLILLANQLLVLARESEAGLTLAPECTSVDDLFRHAARYGWAAGRRSVVVEPVEVPTIWVDRVRLRQAVDNLVDNAFRHGQGIVTLSSIRAGDAVELHVTDEGPGFTADSERVFGRFSHGPDSQGAGLGLAIVAQVAEAHGGAAGARNRAVGGADVWIRLPLRRVSGRSSR